MKDSGLVEWYNLIEEAGGMADEKKRQAVPRQRRAGTRFAVLYRLQIIVIWSYNR